MSEERVSKMITGAFILIETVVILASVRAKGFVNSLDSISAVVFYLLLLWYEKKKGIHIESYIKLFVVLTVFGHNYVGNLLGLYDSRLSFDKLLHVFGAFSFALLATAIASKSIKVPLCSKAYIFLLAASLGISLGSIFEILEFVLDSLFKTNTQTDLIDTDMDLLCDVIGAVFAGIFSISNNSK